MAAERDGASTSGSASSSLPTACASSSTSSSCSANTGFDIYNETYNPVGRVRGRGLGAAPDAVRSARRRASPKSAAIGRRAGERRRRLRGEAVQQRGFPRPCRRASASPAKRAVTKGAPSAKRGSSSRELLVLGEADFIRSQIVAVGAGLVGQNQFVSYLGATFFPTRGVDGGARLRALPRGPVRGGHRAQRLSTSRSNFFPWAHFELVGLARYQSLGPSTTDEASASLFMLQLHYYL